MYLYILYANGILMSDDVAYRFDVSAVLSGIGDYESWLKEQMMEESYFGDEPILPRDPEYVAIQAFKRALISYMESDEGYVDGIIPYFESEKFRDEVLPELVYNFGYSVDERDVIDFYAHREYYSLPDEYVRKGLIKVDPGSFSVYQILINGYALYVEELIERCIKKFGEYYRANENMFTHYAIHVDNLEDEDVMFGTEGDGMSKMTGVIIAGVGVVAVAAAAVVGYMVYKRRSDAGGNGIGGGSYGPINSVKVFYSLDGKHRLEVYEQGGSYGLRICGTTTNDKGATVPDFNFFYNSGLYPTIGQLREAVYGSSAYDAGWSGIVNGVDVCSILKMAYENGTVGCSQTNDDKYSPSKKVDDKKKGDMVTGQHLFGSGWQRFGCFGRTKDTVDSSQLGNAHGLFRGYKGFLSIFTNKWWGPVEVTNCSYCPGGSGTIYVQRKLTESPNIPGAVPDTCISEVDKKAWMTFHGWKSPTYDAGSIGQFASDFANAERKWNNDPSSPYGARYNTANINRLNEKVPWQFRNVAAHVYDDCR